MKLKSKYVGNEAVVRDTLGRWLSDGPRVSEMVSGEDTKRDITVVCSFLHKHKPETGIF